MVDSEKIVRCIVITALVASLSVSGAVGAGSEGPPSDQRGEETVQSSYGIEYRISVYEANSTAVVEARNPTGRPVPVAGYILRVDDQRVHDLNLELSVGEDHVEKIDLTSGLNVNQDNHTVVFSTYGVSAEFNFTRSIDSSDPDEVPRPHISNVTIVDGTIDGEPSAVAKVTLVNPSDQLYSTKLVVHTGGTDGSLYPASVRSGDTRTIKVELLDDRGSKIAGEARLYTGSMATEAGAMDQVEFEGRAGEGTEVWDTAYEPIRPTWVDDSYRYKNGSYGRRFDERLSRGERVGGVPAVYPVAAVLVGLYALRKLR